jgi:hypothetical protein
MSLFFAGERKVAPVAVPKPTTEQVEAALVAIGERRDPYEIGGVGNMPLAEVVRLTALCRAVEPKLLAAIQADTVKLQTEAVQFVRDNTDGAFPAAKFIAVLKENVGGVWADVVAAAKDEAVAAVPEVVEP